MSANSNAYDAGIMGLKGKEFADQFFAEENQVVHESDTVVLVLKKSDEINTFIEEILLATPFCSGHYQIELTRDGRFAQRQAAPAVRVQPACLHRGAGRRSGHRRAPAHPRRAAAGAAPADRRVPRLEERGRARHRLPPRHGLSTDRATMAVIGAAVPKGDGFPGAVLIVPVADIEGPHAELVAKDYPFMRPALEDSGHDWRTLQVYDPFGSRIRFDG